tara:strand:- start:3468 stop:4214 length:747 start_codon:yes stop_codon:yes gene_type:complete
MLSNPNLENRKNKLLNSIVNKENGYKIIDIPNNLFSWLSDSILEIIYQSLTKRNQKPKEKSIKSCLDILKNRKDILLPLKERTINENLVHNKKSLIFEQLSEVITKPSLLLNNNLYYRLVRPSVSQEISTVHRDYYFHSIQEKWATNPEILDLKLWIPLYLTNPFALGLIPGSQNDINFEDCKIIKNNGQKRFECSFSSKDLTPIKVNLKQGLIFPSSMIHGSLASEDLGGLRLSCELTLGYILKDFI